MVRKPSIEQLEKFMCEVDCDFPTPLSAKTNLHAYAEKLYGKGTVCAEYNMHEIVSVVAGYTDNVIGNMGYISMVASKKKVRGQGIAPRLIRQFLTIARDKNLDAVHVYAVESNTAAVNMYMKLGFERFNCENELRPNDLHLIYYFS